MLKSLILAKKIKTQREELDALQAKDETYKALKDDLSADIEAAQTQEEREAVESAAEEYDAEVTAHEAAKAQLTESIAALEKELDELEKPLPAPVSAGAEKKNERMINTMISIPTNIRTLAAGIRVLDVLPQASQQAIMADPETTKFLANVRDLAKRAQASVTGADVGIPTNILPLLTENRYRYSKLYNRVMVRTVRGEAHQPIAGLAPEAIYMDCCDALNELNFSYSMIPVTCHMLGGFVMVCNSLLQETDFDLLADLIEMMSQSLGYAKDKGILYGKGGTYGMPLGVVTRLAQQSRPDNYPPNAPAWVDLHSTHILTIDGNNLDGAAFWAALRIAAGNTFSRYARGEVSWVMNSKTYAFLESKAIATTAGGQWVALIGGRLPIVSGQIDVLEFLPDGDIIGGYWQLYLLAQHETTVLGTDRTGATLRIKNATLIYAYERFDGTPIIPEGFVAMNIMGQSVTTEMTFPANAANDAQLEDLTVGALTLSPTFDAGVMTYTASAANNVASAVVNATAAQAGAEIEITVTSGTTTKKVNNGASAALAVGANVIAVTVKNGNAVKVYTVTVTRAGT